MPKLDKPLQKTIGIIGIGVMGRALVNGFIAKGILPASAMWSVARTEATCQKVTQQLGIEAYLQSDPALAVALQTTETIILCVKPAQLSKALGTLKKAGLRVDTCLISILAGCDIASIETILDQPNPVIRAMTNTPCQVGQAMTVIGPGTHAQPQHLAQAKHLFSAVGQCLEMDESYFDAVTGLSGSGPAYLYLIMEALADGGVRVGLPRDKALAIVAQTVLGAATMVQQSGRHPAALRDDVTTPAGCTIGALLTMEDGKIRSVLARAVEEATHIASQLGKK
jgi:pyrroline-5-carboxylate reductase